MNEISCPCCGQYIDVSEVYQQGYADGQAQAKKKSYDCSCFVDYPNKSHKKKDGSWKCVDKFEKCEDWVGKYIGSCKTHCRRKEKKNDKSL